MLTKENRTLLLDKLDAIEKKASSIYETIANRPIEVKFIYEYRRNTIVITYWETNPIKMLDEERLLVTDKNIGEIMDTMDNLYKPIGNYTPPTGPNGIEFKIKFYGKRTHPDFGCQVLIDYLDDFMWVNIPELWII